MDQNTHTSKTIALIAAGLVVVGALLMFLFNSKGGEQAIEETAPVVPPQGEPIDGSAMEGDAMMQDDMMFEVEDPLTMPSESMPPAAMPPVPTPKGGTTPPAAAPIMPGTGAMDTQSPYKDGTYTTIGDYRSPAGPEQITVKLTLKGGKIVDSTVTGTSNETVSQNFMNKFSQNHKSLVIGKSIDEVKLGVVSGSSLTPKGFNAAVEAIKKEAKS